MKAEKDDPSPEALELVHKLPWLTIADQIRRELVEPLSKPDWEGAARLIDAWASKREAARMEVYRRALCAYCARGIPDDPAIPMQGHLLIDPNGGTHYPSCRAGAIRRIK